MIMYSLAHEKKPEETRHAILLDSAIHARELTSIQMNFYTILAILRDYMEGKEDIVNLLHYHEILFLPTINLDAVIEVHQTYEEHSFFGFNRKNKRDMRCTENKGGVDLNRNFGFKWGYDNEGSSP
jgi:hypothetical protein